MKDLHNHIDVRRALSPKAAVTDNTAYVSEIVNRKGFNSLELVLAIGANTDTNALFTVLIEHGDQANLSDATAVADADLLGTEALASFTAADDDNKVKKIGYTGSKQYVRATVTPSGNDSGNHFLAAIWLLGHPNLVPTPNPPV